MAEYIEREAALEAVKKEREYAGKFSFEEERAWTVGFHQGISFALSDITAIPAADVAPVRHGRWIEENPDCLDGDSVYVCSVCGETWTLIEGTPLDNNMHYCPNCGAKMDGGE